MRDSNVLWGMYLRAWLLPTTISISLKCGILGVGHAYDSLLICLLYNLTLVRFNYSYPILSFVCGLLMVH